MKVTITITKADSFTLKGEKVFDNITKIVEKKDTIELLRNKNWAAILNKERNRIVAVEW